MVNSFMYLKIRTSLVLYREIRTLLVNVFLDHTGEQVTHYVIYETFLYSLVVMDARSGTFLTSSNTIHYSSISYTNVHSLLVSYTLIHGINK